MSRLGRRWNTSCSHPSSQRTLSELKAKGAQGRLGRTFVAEKETYLAFGQAWLRTKIAHSARSEMWLARAWKEPWPAVVLQPSQSRVLPQSPAVGWDGSRLTPDGGGAGAWICSQLVSPTKSRCPAWKHSSVTLPSALQSR